MYRKKNKFAVAENIFRIPALMNNRKQFLNK